MMSLIRLVLCAGLKAAKTGEGVGRPVSMLLSLDYKPADAAAEAALAYAGPAQAIRLGVEVEPSTLPAKLVIFYNGEIPPVRRLVNMHANTLPDDP